MKTNELPSESSIMVSFLVYETLSDLLVLLELVVHQVHQGMHGELTE